VAGDVEDVVGVGLEGFADVFGVADFEDADFGVFRALGEADRIEDDLQFALGIEQGAVALAFIGRAHGDKDLEGSGEGAAALPCDAGQPPQHCHGRLCGQQPVIRQAQRFEGEAEQPAGGLEGDFHGGPDGTAIH